MTRELKSVKGLIDSLTSDEDLRQDLWIHYLSGNASSTFVQRLEILSIYDKINSDFQRKLGVFLQTPISAEAEQALAILSPVEKHVVYLLVLGLSVEDIAGYKSISRTRVQQIVTSIQASGDWQSLRRSFSRCSKDASTKTSA